MISLAIHHGSEVIFSRFLDNRGDYNLFQALKDKLSTLDDESFHFAANLWLKDKNMLTIRAICEEHEVRPRIHGQIEPVQTCACCDDGEPCGRRAFMMFV